MKRHAELSNRIEVRKYTEDTNDGQQQALKQEQSFGFVNQVL